MIDTKEKKILDVTCGSRSIWFDKHHPAALYCDIREEDDIQLWASEDGQSERRLSVKPDIICDFTNLPFPNNSFSLVVFDPPHKAKLSEKSWLAKKYGKLGEDWQAILHDGFCECMRVLKLDGILIFKWSEIEIPAEQVWKAIGQKPLFGHHSGKKSNTFWGCFMKKERETENDLKVINEPEEKGKMNIETKQIFATRTKTLRKERGLSQTELAAALDISRTSVNLYESASRVPDITALARYASFFSVTSDYLLGLSDNRATPEQLKKDWEIVISPDGDDTIAKLYKDGNLAQVNVVSRYYKDEYNMEVAAKEVVKKLFEPQLFTGRAMYAGENSDDTGFTRGKIYQFTDGQCIDDKNCARPYDYATTLDGDDRFSKVFIKVVE